MKFGTQQSAFGKVSRVDALRKAREMGCDGLEVGLAVAGIRTGQFTLPDQVAEAKRIRADFERAGLEIISLTPDILLKHVQMPEVIRATCQLATAMGTRQIRMMMAPHVRWGGPNSKLNEWTADFDGTRDSRDWMRRNAEELGSLLDLSKDHDVRYVFELHHGYVLNSASGMMRLLERHPASRVGIIMDPGNMVYEGNEGWRNSVQIMGEYLGYIHCKNTGYRRENGRWTGHWTALDDGIANYAELVTALKDSGFQGYLSVEDLRGELSLEERVGRGLAYLKGLVASTTRVMPT